MNNKKRAFTLVELMCGMAISLITISLIYMVLNQGFKIFNRTNNFSSIEDSFRNAITDIESEINNTDKNNLYIENFLPYEIDNYEIVEPLMLIDKDTDSVLYIKGKKSNIDNSFIEKIVFDKNTIINNKINVKSSKVIINEINGDVSVLNNNGILEIKVNEIGSYKENRSYSSLINLNKNNELTINFNEEVIEPEIPSEPTPPEEIPTLAKLFAEYTFVVLDTNSFNKRENLLNIQPKYEGETKKIDVSSASYYIQAISTEVMKKYISADSTINNNSFNVNKTIMKPPALKETYIANGLTINGYNEFKNITTVDNGQGKVIKSNNINVGYMYRAANEGILLINGDLNINSNDSKIYLGTAEQGNGHKLTIYVTGKINITMNNKSGEIILNNCTLISGNQININSNNIKVNGQQAGDIGKLQQILNENLKLQ